MNHLTHDELKKLLLDMILSCRSVEMAYINKYIQDFKTKNMTDDGYTHKWVFEKYEQCKSAQENYKVYGPTNNKFPNFVQTIFTAGSKEQFIKYGINELRGTLSKQYIDKVKKTFDYIFYKFKKGVFVQIYDNKISVFLPFSNANYENDWYDQLKVKEDYIPGSIVYSKNPQVLAEYKNKVKQMQMEGVPLPVIYIWENHPEYPINKNMKQWYANNCIFNTSLRKEVGNTGKDKWGGKAGLPDEGDKSVALFLEFLSMVCMYKQVNDTCFFLNVRDFPILKKNGKHPYDIIFCPDKQGKTGKLCDIPVIIDNPKELIPIFSQSTPKDNSFLDKLIPTEDEIGEVLDITTLPNCTSSRVVYAKDSLYQIPWRQRKNVALFRGSLSGCSVYNNQRLELAYLSIKYPTLIDAKLTHTSKRVKKHNRYLTISPPHKFKMNKEIVYYKNLTTDKKLTNKEQAEYKYLIIVEGNVAAFRLARMMSWGSLLIVIDTIWQVWFEKNTNFRYYEDITVKNFKNTHGLKIKAHNGKINEKHLIDTIKWCGLNDKLCYNIALNGVKYWEKNLNKYALLDYMAKEINNLHP